MSGRLQNFSNWIGECSKYSIEVIIVEDGLDKDTLNELSTILKEIPKLNYKMISDVYGSAGNARNAGINETTGKWICFWDSDDEVQVNQFIQMVELAEARNLEAVVGKFEIVSELSGRITQPLGGNFQSIEVIARMPGLWRMAFRKTCISQKKFQPFRVAEDHHFLVDINFEKMRFQYFNSTVYKYFTDGQGHITQNLCALEDLYLASVQMRQNIRDKKNNTIMPYFFLIREAISTLKYSSLKTKMILLKSTFRFSYRSNITEKIYVIKTVFSILSTEIFIRIKSRYHNSTTIILVGGLGNQLFQSVAALVNAGAGLAKLETGFLNIGEKRIDRREIAQYTFPENTKIIHSEKWKVLTQKIVSYCLRVSAIERGFERSSLWRSVIQLLGTFYFTCYYKKFSSLYLSKGVGFSDIKRSYFNKILIGYFQSYYWHDQLSFIWPAYKVQLETKSEIVNYYSNLALDEKPLVIHIRFGDYQNEPSFGILPKEYYLSACNSLIMDEEFKKIWVFSDDIEMAKNFLPLELQTRTRWIGNLDDFASTSLEIMHLGEAFVLSNSTFGWWGAKLSKKTPVTVIAPSPWFRSRTSPDKLLPESWRTLSFWE